MSKKAHKKAKRDIFNANLKQENAVILRKANQGQFQESKPLVLKNFSDLRNAEALRANGASYNSYNNNNHSNQNHNQNNKNHSYQNNSHQNSYSNQYNSYQKNNGHSESKPLVNNSYNAAKTTLKIVQHGSSHQEKKQPAQYARELSKSVSEKINVAVKKINTIITTAKQKSANNGVKSVLANQHHVLSQKSKETPSQKSIFAIALAVVGITVLIGLWIGNENSGSAKKSYTNAVESMSTLKSYSHSQNEFPKITSYEVKKDMATGSSAENTSKTIEIKDKSSNHSSFTSTKAKSSHKKVSEKASKMKAKAKSGKSNKIAKTHGKKSPSAKKFATKKVSKSKKSAHVKK